MSMIGHLRTASDQTLARLQDDSDALMSYLELDSPEDHGLGGDYRLRLVRYEDVEDVEGDESAGVAVSDETSATEAAGALLQLDKAWHGIHFLLTGSAWSGVEPLCFLAVGGEEIGDDLGYGQPRAWTSRQVAQLADELEGIDSQELRRRFNPSRMALEEIYPQIWDEGDEAFDYLEEHYHEMRSFVRKAAAQRLGLLVYLL